MFLHFLVVGADFNRRTLFIHFEGDDNPMARTKKDPADAVAALLDSVSATSPGRRGRPKGSKNKPKAAAAPAKTVSRRGRPKGSKNKRSAVKAPAKRAAAVAQAPKAAVAIKPVVRRRRRRAAKAPVVQTLSQRVDSMIAELGKLRAEVGQLEKLRDVLKAING
ncbi:MAG: hypothetical protein IPF82_05165 [Blastocatellia bacterium]|nr:hypothetical protein [Blastocatellia bacterium]